MAYACRNFKNNFSRPLFTIIFRSEMLKFHPYSILTGDTMVGFVFFRQPIESKLFFLYVLFAKFAAFLFLTYFRNFTSIILVVTTRGPKFGHFTALFQLFYLFAVQFKLVRSSSHVFINPESTNFFNLRQQTAVEGLGII